MCCSKAWCALYALYMLVLCIVRTLKLCEALWFHSSPAGWLDSIPNMRGSEHRRQKAHKRPPNTGSWLHPTTMSPELEYPTRCRCERPKEGLILLPLPPCSSPLLSLLPVPQLTLMNDEYSWSMATRAAIVSEKNAHCSTSDEPERREKEEEKGMWRNG